MRQILQDLKSGVLEVAELPAPAVRRGAALIQSRASLISAGTERMLIEFGRGNLIQKARQQPEKVKQVLDKIRADGLVPTLEAVFRKLDEPLPLGYCNAGTVLEVGAGVHDLRPGDRVASNGPHAELVCVPRHLCARIPDGVTDEHAAFTVLGSVALQGLRLAAPTLGERFLVFGVGLLGLLTVQLLRANGCRVLAVDPNGERLRLAQIFGAHPLQVTAGSDPVAAAVAWSEGRGIDGVLITASAKTDDIVHQAAQACRKRGRIVLVGVVGLNLRRSDFYDKELTFQVSCSYGPGRYDDAYEQRGHDYPLGYVRWTEQRNFEAVLDLLDGGKLDVAPLITDRFDVDEAPRAYAKIQSDPRALGVLLRYPADVERHTALRLRQSSPRGADGVVAGVVGAGNFAKAVLLPALSATSAQLAYVANRQPAAAAYAARKFGAAEAVTDYRRILEDSRVNAVFILVGHRDHAPLVVEALAAGKHVFVEKPLALDAEQLADVAAAVDAAPAQQLAVGYNRRFSPHTVRLRQLLASRGGPLCMTITINAGEIPADHWIQDPERGGGRIIGEACHFFDLLAFLADSPIVAVSAAMITGGAAVREDKMSILLSLADGSIATVNYFANGAKRYPKETLEVFSDGRVARLDNFRVTRGYGFAGFSSYRSPRQDKGHRAEIAAFVDAVARGGSPLMPFAALHNVSLASFAAVEAARTGSRIALPQSAPADAP